MRTRGAYIPGCERQDMGSDGVTGFENRPRQSSTLRLETLRREGEPEMLSRELSKKAEVGHRRWRELRAERDPALEAYGIVGDGDAEGLSEGSA